MLRNLLAGLGVVFALILVFLASFLGRTAYDMQAQGQAYEQLAVDITRKLACNWSIADIKAHYASAIAHERAGPEAERALSRLKPLGALRYVDNVSHSSGFTRAALMRIASPADATELMAELLRRSVRISFRAKFEHGFADVTIELKSEAGAMRLWRLQIDSHDQLNTPRPGPVAIGRA